MRLLQSVRAHLATAALTLLAFAAAILVYVDREQLTATEVRERGQMLFVHWDEEAVTELELNDGRARAVARRSSPDGAPMVGAPAWSLWLNEQPEALEEQRLDEYLTKLGTAEIAREVPSGSVDRVQVGLDPAARSIAVRMGDKVLRVALGGPAPNPLGGIYAELDDRGVVVLGAEVAKGLSIAPHTLRSRAVIPFSITELRSLALEGDGGTRNLERAPWAARGGSSFRFDGSDGMGKVRADDAAMGQLLRSLGSLEATSFLPDDVAEAALEAKVMVALRRNDGGLETRLALGGTCPGSDDRVVLVRTKPSRLATCVPKQALEVLSMPAERLVDHHVVGSPSDELIELQIEQGSLRLDLARKETGWQLRTPESRSVDGKAGKALLAALLETTLPDLGVPAQACGLETPRAKLTIHSSEPLGSEGEARARIERVVVGPDRDGSTCVLREEDGSLGRMPTSAVASLLPTPRSLRPLQLLDEDETTIQTLRIKGPSTSTMLRRSADGTWGLDQPSGFRVDAILVRRLLGQLAHLEVSRWVDTPAGADEPDRARWTIEMVQQLSSSTATATPKAVERGQGEAVAPKSRVLRLQLLRAMGNETLATLEGEPMAFVLPRDLEEEVSLPPIDRSVLALDLDRMSSIVLSTPDGGASRTLTKEADGTWTERSRPQPSADTKSLVDALNDLYPEAAISLGPALREQGLLTPKATLKLRNVTRGEEVLVRVGASAMWRGIPIVYTRREGVDATFVVAQSKVSSLLESLGKP